MAKVEKCCTNVPTGQPVPLRDQAIPGDHVSDPYFATPQKSESDLSKENLNQLASRIGYRYARPELLKYGSSFGVLYLSYSQSIP